MKSLLLLIVPWIAPLTELPPITRRQPPLLLKGTGPEQIYLTDRLGLIVTTADGRELTECELRALASKPSLWPKPRHGRTERLVIRKSNPTL